MLCINHLGRVSSENLALEQYLFDTLPEGESCFLLWQNSPSVIVGRYQNTAEEVNGPFLREKDIPVVRRMSGGGAVYHDLGNINYTFIVPGSMGETLELELFCRPVLAALRHMGIQAGLAGRNDLVVNGKKFSGSAQYSRGGRTLHHGTLLFHSDLDTLSQALRPTWEKVASKGISSVRSRVTNLIEHMPQPIALEEFRGQLWRYIITSAGGHEVSLDAEAEDGIRRLCRERYSQWEWNWGQSPASTLRREKRFEGCGTVQALLTLERGRIEECRFYGDFFGEGPSQELLSALKHCAAEPSALSRALENVDVGRCFMGLERAGLVDLLTC